MVKIIKALNHTGNTDFLLAQWAVSMFLQVNYIIIIFLTVPAFKWQSYFRFYGLAFVDGFWLRRLELSNFGFIILGPGVTRHPDIA